MAMHLLKSQAAPSEPKLYSLNKISIKIRVICQRRNRIIADIPVLMRFLFFNFLLKNKNKFHMKFHMEFIENITQFMYNGCHFKKYNLFVI